VREHSGLAASLFAARSPGGASHAVALVCEGELIGKTREQLRSLHFRRNRDWLQS
jgi:hypothetical protein